LTDSRRGANVASASKYENDGWQDVSFEPLLSVAQRADAATLAAIVQPVDTKMRTIRDAGADALMAADSPESLAQKRQV
jgi:hypothetical protein